MKWIIWFLAIGLIPVNTVLGSTEEPTEKHENTHEKKGFNPGNFILEHIADAYEWHVLTYKDYHVSIYLPVIILSKENGLVVFSSRKLHHGHTDYIKNGIAYRVAHEGEYEGKIVEINPSGNTVRPLDFSITKNVAALFVSLILILWIFLSMANRYKKNPSQAPRGIQSFLEPIVIFIRDEVAKPSIGHKYEKFMPYLLTVFFFIWINNMLGLIPVFPGGANLTGNISITIVLALFTFIITNVQANKNYWKHIFNAPGVPWWLKAIPIMPLVELMGIFTKPFALMIRLFANITAGHIIVLAFFGLIFIFGEKNLIVGYGLSVPTLMFTIFMTFLELLVAFVQAFVFTLLSAVYFGMAVEEHH